MELTNEDVGRSIRQVRADRKMTQAALAESVGCGREAINSYECGRTRPRGGTLRLVAKVLGVGVSRLLRELDWWHGLARLPNGESSQGWCRREVEGLVRESRSQQHERNLT